MSETTILEPMVNDLLSRVQKLEATQAVTDLKNVNDYLTTLDRVAFSMTIAIDIISKILIDKNLTTKEELQKLLTEERERVTKTISEQVKVPETPVA